MASYKFTVNVDEEILKQMSGYKLCMAKAVADSKDPNKVTYNVVCVTSDVLDTVEITWKDSYSICGSEKLFEKGGVLAEGHSKIASIEYGQEYVLTGWQDPVLVQANKSAPENGFLFQNKVAATTIIFNTPITVGGVAAGAKPVPIYVSPTKRIPGATQLIPRPKAAFFFAQDTVTRSMIDLTIGTSCMVDFTDETSWHVKYDANFQWVGLAKDKEGSK